MQLCNAFSANCSVNAILSCIKHFFWVLQGGVVNMEEEFLSLGLDIIGLGVFNYKFGSITTESPVIKVCTDHARISLVVNNRIRRLLPGLYLHTQDTFFGSIGRVSIEYVQDHEMCSHSMNVRRDHSCSNVCYNMTMENLPCTAQTILLQLHTYTAQILHLT